MNQPKQPSINRFRAAARALAVCGTMALGTANAGETRGYLGPCALVASSDGRTLYVANVDARQVACVDVAGGKVVRRIGVPAAPTGLALSPDGTKLAVTCAASSSTVLVLDAISGEATATIRAGHTATGPAFAPDGKRLYVCNRFDNDVSVIDFSSGKELARVRTVREPIGAAVTPDGKTLLVINHMPADRADGFYIATEVTAIDTRTRRTTSIRLPNGSINLRGLCVAPDGRYAYVTHVLANYELIPSQLDQGWANTNVLSVIDTAGKKLINTIGLDELYLGAANPQAVACTADGQSICVAHAGTHELSVIDAPAALGKLLGTRPESEGGIGHAGGGVYASPTVSGVTSGMGRLAGLRQRIPLRGRGPRGLAVAGSKVYVTGYFSDTIDVVDLRSEPGGQIRTIALGPAPQPDVRRRGEMLFHDATICYQHWHSCASCHPDARADGLNWDLRNDGVGNPKNTRSMLLAHRTPPAMSRGIRASAEAAVRAGLEHILFTRRPDADAAAIDEYLKALRPVPSPRLTAGRLSPAARRGKQLFESDRVGCHKCHSGPLYTNGLMHKVDTRGAYDVGDRFDTPTLVEVWRTAPYLHDGRYTTIRELIAAGQHGKTRGQVDKLTGDQIGDLVEFVLSL